MTVERDSEESSDGSKRSRREPKPESMRLFVAIELPDSWKMALGSLESEMQRAIDADPEARGHRIRWVQPEGIHLTLKFLGEVPADKLESIKDALARAVSETPDLRIAIGDVGTFGGRQGERVVWVAIGQKGSLFTGILKEQIETWLGALGFPREPRLVPHLTLARLPQEISAATRRRIVELAKLVALPEVQPFAVEHVSLMRSYLGPGGARYEQVATFPE